MNHDKIKEVLNALSACCVEDCDMATATERAIDEAMELIRSLRTECDNQATRIVDLEQAASAEPMGWLGTAGHGYSFTAIKSVADSWEAHGTHVQAIYTHPAPDADIVR